MKAFGIISCRAGVITWNGAKELALMTPEENGSNEWLEAVDDDTYGKIK